MVDVGAQAASRAARRSRAATVLMAPETARRHPRPAEGRRARDGAARRDHGREADERPDPALPPAAALARRASSSTVGEGRVDIIAVGRDRPRRPASRWRRSRPRASPRSTIYDMAKAIDKGMVITRRHARREDEGRGVKAAVLTVSDRVSRGEAEDGSGDTLEELLRADGYEVERRLVPDEADQIAAAIVELAGGRGARAHDGRHRPRGARRHARGDPHGARARGAGDLAGDPRRLDREDAARPALARRRRHGRQRRSSSTSPARPARCRDGYAVLQPALTHALKLLADQKTATDHVHTYRERRASGPARARPDRDALRAARQDRAHRLRAAVRLRRRAARGRRGPVRRTTCSGSRSRWSARARSRWRSTG